VGTEDKYRGKFETVSRNMLKIGMSVWRNGEAYLGNGAKLWLFINVFMRLIKEISGLRLLHLVSPQFRYGYLRCYDRSLKSSFVL